MGRLYLPPSKRRPSQSSRVRLYGDKTLGAEVAQRHLNRLWTSFRQLCSFQGLQQNLQRVDFVDGPYAGGFAILRKTFGVEAAEIFVPPSKEETRTKKTIESKTSEGSTRVYALELGLNGGVYWRYDFSGDAAVNPLLSWNSVWTSLGEWEPTIPDGETNTEVSPGVIHGTRFPDGPSTGGTKTVEFYMMEDGVETGAFPYLPTLVQTFGYSEDYFYDFYYDLTLYREPASAAGGWHLNYSGEGLWNIGALNDFLTENPVYHAVVYRKFSVDGSSDQSATLEVNPLNGDTASPSRSEIASDETKTYTNVFVVNGQQIVSMPESEGILSAGAYHYRGFGAVPEPAETTSEVSYSGEDQILTIWEQFKSEGSQSNQILTAYSYGATDGHGTFYWKKYGCMVGTAIVQEVSGKIDEWRSIGDFEWNPWLMTFRAPGLVTRITQITTKPEK